MPHRLFKVRTLALAVVAFPAALGRCIGTEADNPVADLVVTACKSSDEYDPAQLDGFLSRAPQAARAESGRPKSTALAESTGASRQALTAAAEIPNGLSCVEWQLVETSLSVQIVNFNANCGAQWQGEVTRDGDRVTFELENQSCTLARCGGCLFDTASVIELPASGDLTLALSMDLLCEGEPEILEWQLPLATQPRGMSCKFAPSEVPDSSTGPAFTRCGESLDTCDTGLACVSDGAQSAHCLPACANDTDCPLEGGTRCDAGRCVPAMSLGTEG